MSESLIKNRMDDDIMNIDEEDEDTQANKYLTFRLAKESFGISIRQIKEIIELQNIIEVPDMPYYMKGVINLRGKVIPVIDLRLRFHIEERAYDDRNCIIIIEIDNNNSNNIVGFIVDTVEEVLEITEKNIESSANVKTNSTKDKYIWGLGKVGDSVKILLDVRKILFEEDVKIMEEMSSQNKER